MNLIRDCLIDKYADFSGRAGRKEYWSFQILTQVIFLSLIIGQSNQANFKTLNGFLIVVFILIIIVPTLTVTVRRLHDTNRSGWWMLVVLFLYVPIGIIFMCLKGTSGANRYGKVVGTLETGGFEPNLRQKVEPSPRQKTQNKALIEIVRLAKNGDPTAKEFLQTYYSPVVNEGDKDRPVTNPPPKPVRKKSWAESPAKGAGPLWVIAFIIVALLFAAW